MERSRNYLENYHDIGALWSVCLLFFSSSFVLKRNFLRLSTLLTFLRTFASLLSSKVSTSSREMSSIMLLLTPSVPGEEALNQN